MKSCAAWLLCLFAGLAQAAEVVVPAPACSRDASASCTAPFLWQVEGAKARHYLMGSVHLLPESAYPLPAAYEAAYAAAEAVVFESDIGALSDPKTQLKLLNDATAPAGLKTLVGAELYQRVQDFAVAKDLPPQICDSFKPWFCAMTLELLAFMKSDYRSDLGLDQHYYARAASAQKSILWLEEPAAHLKIFTAMPEPVALQLLVATLQEQGDDGVTPEQLLQAWRSNDVAGLEKILGTFRQEQPLLYERILSARNRAWMPRLTAMLDSATPHLVLVGAAHLPGADGLLPLLKARGYIVTPVTGAAKP